MCLTLAANQILIVGSGYLSQGVNTAIDALDSLENTFSNLVFSGDELSNEGNAIVQYFQSAMTTTSTCDTQPLINEMNSAYFPNVNLYQSDVSPVPNDCDTAANNLEYYGVNTKNNVIWVLYVVMTLGVLIYAVGLWFKSKLILKVSIGMSELLMVIFFVVCTIEMIALVSSIRYQ